LKAYRGEITTAEMSQSIAAFEQDVATNRCSALLHCGNRRTKSRGNFRRSLRDARLPHLGHHPCAAALVIGTKRVYHVRLSVRERWQNRVGLNVKPREFFE